MMRIVSAPDIALSAETEGCLGDLKRVHRRKNAHIIEIKTEKSGCVIYWSSQTYLFSCASHPLHHWLLRAAKSVTLCCCVTMRAGPDFDGCFAIAPLCIPLEGKPMSAFESVRPEVLRHYPPDRIQVWLSLHHC